MQPPACPLSLHWFFYLRELVSPACGVYAGRPRPSALECLGSLRLQDEGI